MNIKVNISVHTRLIEYVNMYILNDLVHIQSERVSVHILRTLCTEFSKAK